jgi:outer membrane receptor protein involved in Fe transport
MKTTILALTLPMLAAWAQTGQGTIAGLALDAQTGRPVRGALIAVEGQNVAVVTDVDGAFRIAIAPGSYKLRITSPNYLETTIEGVEVKAGEVTESSTVLAGKGTVTTVEVVEKVGPVAANAEAMLQERRLSPVVTDALSAEELRAGTASDAAAALEKVTGVSIVDGGFVYVRGLGERYSATMLNGALIPTTEPEKRVVPLDLFPSSLIDSIRVLKTYSPDLPGEFSGGLVQMNTIEFPAAPTLRFGYSTGFNSRTTFKPFRSYPGGSRDAFGFEDGTRALPGVIPSDRRLFVGAFSSQQLQEAGRAFANNWEPAPRESMRPEQSFNLVGGNTYGRLGIVGALTFTNKPQTFQEIQNYYYMSGPRQVLFTEYPDYNASMESARLGGVLNAALRLTPSSKLVFRNTLTRDTDKEARVFRGYQGGIDSDVEATRLRWVERGLFSTGVEGDHSFARLGNGLLRWQLTYSRSTRDEPDLRETFRGLQQNGQYEFLALPQSGLRFYNGLTDRIYEPLVEWGQPFYRGWFSGLFKVGFRATFRDRDFAARRFRYVPIRSATLNFALPANQLFAPANIRPDGFELRELTRGTDSYDARMNIYGGFAMADLALGRRWRLIAGVRVEDADIDVTTIDPLIPGARPATASLVNRDPLPAVNAIYALTPRQNLRFAYSKTVSRPDFRELSPFDFSNVLGGFNMVGNPNLKRARIDNMDARWEWFLGANQVVAASYFVKRFDDPIESTIELAQELRQTFINADSARNQGVEIEFRRNLGFLSRSLSGFALQSNATVVDSNVKIPAALAVVLTSKERAMAGQSRYIFNVITEWTRPRWRSGAKFYVNSVSRRITDLGTVGLPDIYQERTTLLDAVYQFDIREAGKWSVRFSAENIGDTQYRWTQGGMLQRLYQVGRTFTVGTSYAIF